MSAVTAANDSGIDISYTVSMEDARSHNFRVSMTLEGLTADTLVLKMPVWTPGYYWIQNYPKNLSRLEIRNASGEECIYWKKSKNVWKVVTGGSGSLTASWVVYGNSHSVADAFIDTTHAFIVPAALFLYPEEALASPSRITFDLYPGWSTISTGLEPVADSAGPETSVSAVGPETSLSAAGHRKVNTSGGKKAARISTVPEKAASAAGQKAASAAGQKAAGAAGQENASGFAAAGTSVTGYQPLKGLRRTYTASCYDVLFDSPVLAGNQEVLTFAVNALPHNIAVLNPGSYDREALTRDYSRVVESAVSIIGEMPYSHYTFLIMGKGMGGLEHLNSMAVFTGREDGDIYPSDRRSFRGWMEFIAHEFFHLYNIKTIRPIALGPFDYDRENYTNMLWVSEGFTVYYENIIMNRAGFMTPDEMLESLSRSITAYESIPGSRVQSATLSSFDTWINFFSRSENSQNTTISYYDKGCGLGLLLDLKIRYSSGNSKSLDDVMRTLYYSYHKGLGRGFTDEEFRMECEKAAGTDLGELFGWASSTVRPDYDRYLDYAGLYLNEEAPSTPGGRARYVIMKKEVLTPAQETIFNDLFRKVN
jgi:predicted metalloprotease with PDZ domain